jgi:hypothetical protein
MINVCPSFFCYFLLFPRRWQSSSAAGMRSYNQQEQACVYTFFWPPAFAMMTARRPGMTILGALT